MSFCFNFFFVSRSDTPENPIDKQKDAIRYKKLDGLVAEVWGPRRVGQAGTSGSGITEVVKGRSNLAHSRFAAARERLKWGLRK